MNGKEHGCGFFIQGVVNHCDLSSFMGGVKEDLFSKLHCHSRLTNPKHLYIVIIKINICEDR